jgi:hypothetical protein
MEELKIRNPRIYSVDESDVLRAEICHLLNQFKKEDRVDDLISRMTRLKSDLDQPLTESKMRDVSIQYNDTKLESIHFFNKKSFDRKLLEKYLMDSLTSNKDDDDLIIGMSGDILPWICGD